MCMVKKTYLLKPLSLSVHCLQVLVTKWLLKKFHKQSYAALWNTMAIQESSSSFDNDCWIFCVRNPLTP